MQKTGSHNAVTFKKELSTFCVTFHCLISSYYKLVTQFTKLIIPEFFQAKS